MSETPHLDPEQVRKLSEVPEGNVSNTRSNEVFQQKKVPLETQRAVVGGVHPAVRKKLNRLFPFQQ
jgi:hypothetical protein